MTSNEFHKHMEDAAKRKDAKAVEMLCQKFINELSVDISKTIANKCTALTGGLVAEMLRRYAAEVEENTATEGKMLSMAVFLDAKQNTYRVEVPLGVGEEK